MINETDIFPANINCKFQIKDSMFLAFKSEMGVKRLISFFYLLLHAIISML